MNIRTVHLLAAWLAPVAVTLLSLELFAVKVIGQIQYAFDNSKNANIEVRNFEDSKLVLLTVADSISSSPSLLGGRWISAANVD